MALLSSVSADLRNPQGRQRFTDQILGLVDNSMESCRTILQADEVGYRQGAYAQWVLGFRSAVHFARGFSDTAGQAEGARRVYDVLSEIFPSEFPFLPDALIPTEVLLQAVRGGANLIRQRITFLEFVKGELEAKLKAQETEITSLRATVESYQNLIARNEEFQRRLVEAISAVSLRLSSSPIRSQEDGNRVRQDAINVFTGLRTYANRLGSDASVLAQQVVDALISLVSNINIAVNTNVEVKRGGKFTIGGGK